MTLKIGPYIFNRVRYDRDADVMYLAQGDPVRAVDFEETPDGHAVSYDSDGEVVGLTLVDVSRLLDETKGDYLLLKLPVSERSVSVSHAELEFALQGVLSNHPASS